MLKDPDPETHNHVDHQKEIVTPEKSFHLTLGNILLVLAVIIIAFCIPAFVVRSYEVDGQSMETTLDNNDRLIVDKIPRTVARITGHPYIPNRGDIIIFNEEDLQGFTGKRTLIKRVIGLPSDHIVIKNGSVTVYDKAHPQGFNPDTTGSYKIQQPIIGGVDVKLSNNQLYVMGDNRPDSEDSRYFGPIDASQIIGKLVLRFWPPGKAEAF